MQGFSRHILTFFRYSSSSLRLRDLLPQPGKHHLKTYYHEKITDTPLHERISFQRLHERPLLRWLGVFINPGSDPMALGGILHGLPAFALTAPSVRAPLRGAFFYAFTPLCGSLIYPVFPLFIRFFQPDGITRDIIR